MAESGKLAALKRRAKEQVMAARKKSNREQAKRLARQGGQRSREIAERLAAETGGSIQGESDSPAQRAGKTAQMGAPIQANLQPTAQPKQLQMMARADTDPAREQSDQSGNEPAQRRRQPDPLVQGIGFNQRRPVEPQQTPNNETGQREQAAQGPRLDEMVFGFGGTSDESTDQATESDPMGFGFNSMEIGLSFDDDNDGGLL